MVCLCMGCMEPFRPATTSQATPCHNNNATLIDNYVKDDSDYNNKQLITYSELSDSKSEEKLRGVNMLIGNGKKH